MAARAKRAAHNAAGVVAAGTVAQVVGLLQRLDDCPPDAAVSLDDYITVMRTIEGEARRRRENAERMRGEEG